MIQRILLLMVVAFLVACAPTIKLEQYGKGLKEFRA